MDQVRMQSTDFTSLVMLPDVVRYMPASDVESDVNRLLEICRHGVVEAIIIGVTDTGLVVAIIQLDHLVVVADNIKVATEVPPSKNINAKTLAATMSVSLCHRILTEIQGVKKDLNLFYFSDYIPETTSLAPRSAYKFLAARKFEIVESTPIAHILDTFTHHE